MFQFGNFEILILIFYCNLYLCLNRQLRSTIAWVSVLIETTSVSLKKIIHRLRCAYSFLLHSYSSHTITIRVGFYNCRCQLKFTLKLYVAVLANCVEQIRA